MVDVKEPRTYGGQTGLERAAGRREALLDAAFALVAEQGWRSLNVEGVCRRAGLNKRYFYDTFETLDALIGAVTTRLTDDAIAVTLGALDDTLPRDESTAAAIAAFIIHLTDDPRRLHVLFGAVPASDAAAGHRAQAMRDVIAMVAAQGRETYGLADDPTVDLTAAMVVGGTSQALLDWVDGSVTCSRDELIETVVDLWHAAGDAATARARRSS